MRGTPCSFLIQIFTASEHLHENGHKSLNAIIFSDETELLSVTVAENAVIRIKQTILLTKRKERERKKNVSHFFLLTSADGSAFS